MTDDRNFDRLARAWLDLMPDEAPDRTISAVLQAVEASPQVRPPSRWLPWRPSPMNRTPRVLGTAIVATVVVAGVLLLTRPASQPDVSSSSDPSPSASPSAPAAFEWLPAELRHRWMGGERPVPGIAPGAGTIIDFTDSPGVFITQSDQHEPQYLRSRTSSVHEGQIRLETIFDDGQCLKGDTGLYSWSLSPRGRILTITADGDDCSARLGAVPGVWWRVGCNRGPVLASNTPYCLGELEAGTYKSQYVRPHVDPVADRQPGIEGWPWQPDFGALTYTVPEGWAQVDDSLQAFSLMPARDYAGWPYNASDVSLIALATHPRAVSACSGGLANGVGHTLEDLITWLRQEPGLVTTEPTATTVNGHPGQSIDITLSSSAVRCAGHSIPEVSYLTHGVQTSLLGLDSRHRVTLVDVGDGDVLLISIRAKADRFEAFAAQATPIIDSFIFE